MTTTIGPYKAYKHSYKNTVPEIPNHWDAVKLKWITRFSYGDSLAAETREDGNVPVYGSNGIVGLHTSSITKAPCIIIGRKGSYGKINFSEKPCFPIDTTYFIDEWGSKNNIRWLFYVLQNLGLDEYSQDSAVPGLSREYAYSIELPYTKILQEQHTIAQFLDHKTALIDQYIANKQRQIQLLEKLRTSIISEAVTQGLNPDVEKKDSGVKWLGKVPVHWQLLKLKRVCTLKSGEGITSEQISEDGEYPVYGGNGLRGYTYSFTHEGRYALIGRQGALCGNINYAEGKFWASEHAVVVSPKKDLNTTWIGELLRVMNLNQYSIAAAQPGLAVESLGNLFIPYPSIDEQCVIARFLESKISQMDHAVNQLKAQITKMETYRTSLISEVVNGKIDVRDFKLPVTEISA